MAHWYNIKGAEFEAYCQKNFDHKWDVLDEKSKGEIDIGDGVKFVRDFIGGTI